MLIIVIMVIKVIVKIVGVPWGHKITVFFK